MPEILNCFPLTVFKDKLGLQPEYRHQIGQHIIQSCAASKLIGQSASRSWTGDRNGHEFLHMQDAFAPMLKAIHQRIRRYVDALGLDADRFRFQFTRSWGTVSEKGQKIQRHRHNQSHISLAYYPLKGPNSGNIIFHMPDPQNEFTAGLFEPHSHDMGLIKTPNILNSEIVTLPAEEDDIVLFPSKTYHATEPNQTDGPRISISTDIVVTLRESDQVEFVMPDVSKWRSSDGF